MRRIFMLSIQKPCRRFNTWHSTVALALALAGCGESGSHFGGLQRYAVKGKVLLADGKPLTAGRVIFLSSAPPASAAADIGGDGSFEFKGPSGDGLPAATYRVYISPGPAAKPAFASKYLDEDTSGLDAPVTSDESKNNFEFKLATKDSKEPAQRGRRRDDK
jgi:hypothetical protein